MEFNFGKKLKELRNLKSTTQESLASHLSISPQAVSKWERNEGYPDIMLLPRIAHFFGVTVDELLGTDEEIVNEKINEWEIQSSKLRHDGERKKDLELWENAYREYPNNPEVIFNYMHALWSEFNNNFVDAEQSREEGEKVIALGKKVLEYSSESEYRDHAIQLIAFTYKDLGNIGEAEKYAKMQANISTCSDTILRFVYDGDKQIKHCQEYVINLIDVAALTISDILEHKYPTEIRIKMMKYALDLYEGIFTDGDYGFYSTRMSMYSRKLSRLYAIAGDRDNCIKYLDDALKFSIMHDEYQTRGEVVKHTSPLADKVESNPLASIKNYTENDCSLVLQSLDFNLYDPYRDDADFIRIKTELEARAVMGA